MINSINSILNKFLNVRVLLLGDIMLDKYVYGDIDRISPEAPIPVLHHIEEKNMLGGAGNVFRNLISLSGKNHVLISVTGKDDYHIQIKNLLEDTGKYHLFIDEERDTTLKMRLIAQKQQTIRYDKETIKPLNSNLYNKIFDVYIDELKSCDIVVLSDYGKGFFSNDFIKSIIKAAKEAGKKVIIDPKNRDYSCYSGADYIKPNKKELSESSGENLKTTEDIIKAAKNICKKYSIDNIIVTLGENGMIHVPAEGDHLHSKLDHSPEVFDLSGAGDTALSVLALSLASGINISQSMYTANAASQIVIGKSGTATATPEEILHFFHRQNIEESPENLFNKIVTLPNAKKIIQVWRNEGDTICFTNGCFDLLHYGHISSFLQAKKHADRLIAAVNSDSSVRKNKGPSRPIQDEKTRASLLAVLQCIDLVIIFDDETAMPLVEELHPDVIAKEGYSIENWAEARYVQSYGGEVVFLKREEGYSTSSLAVKLNMLKAAANAQ